MTSESSVFPLPLVVLSAVTILLAVFVITLDQRKAWHQSATIFENGRDRARFMVRINPLFLLAYWLWWSIPLAIGFVMFLRDTGHVWERTEKIDANHDLIRQPVDA